MKCFAACFVAQPPGLARDRSAEAYSPGKPAMPTHFSQGAYLEGARRDRAQILRLRYTKEMMYIK